MVLRCFISVIESIISNDKWISFQFKHLFSKYRTKFVKSKPNMSRFAFAIAFVFFFKILAGLPRAVTVKRYCHINNFRNTEL